jgi:hypothetical protein
MVWEHPDSSTRIQLSELKPKNILKSQSDSSTQCSNLSRYTLQFCFAQTAQTTRDMIGYSVRLNYPLGSRPTSTWEPYRNSRLMNNWAQLGTSSRSSHSQTQFQNYKSYLESSSTSLAQTDRTPRTSGYWTPCTADSRGKGQRPHYRSVQCM